MKSVGELPAAAFGVEPAEKGVVMLALDRRSVSAEVPRHADGHSAVSVDRPRTVLGRPGPGFVPVREPVGDECGAPLDRVAGLVPWVISVLDVLAEERPDRVLVVGAPGLEVAIEPALKRLVVHARDSTSARRIGTRSGRH
jgi:hypothetical protein